MMKINNFENSEEIALVLPSPLSLAPQNSAYPTDWQRKLRKSEAVAWDLGTLPDVLYLVFNHLNGESLHRARQVCREWDWVIRLEVWGSTEGQG